MHITNIESCRATLFIFGATGDLATKKILPSLQQWYGDETPFAKIWCLGRRPLDETAFFSLVESKGGFKLSDVLKNRIRYHALTSMIPRPIRHWQTSLTKGRPPLNVFSFWPSSPKPFLPLQPNCTPRVFSSKTDPTIACCSKNPSAIAWKLQGKSNPILWLWRQKNNCTGSTITWVKK